MDIEALLGALRDKPVPRPVVTPPSKPIVVATPEAAPKSVQGPMIEFNRRDGRVESIDVRTNGKVRTLIVNRDEENNILSATLVKERK